MFIYSISASLAVAVLAWYLVPYAIRKYTEKRLANRCRDRKYIVLSYDDGPSRRTTTSVLDVLDGHGKANFFLLGRNTVKNTDIVERLLASGHEVGSHSHNHINAWKSGPLRPIQDVDLGLKTLHSIGVNGKLFRPPYGKMTLGTLALCAWRKVQLAWWTIDTKDTLFGKAGGKSVYQILDELSSQGGGVVLMHDFDRSPDQSGQDPSRDYVIELTKSIIEFAEAEGYELARYSDVFR